jgi:hypothetical protein
MRHTETMTASIDSIRTPVSTGTTGASEEAGGVLG